MKNPINFIPFDSSNFKDIAELLNAYNSLLSNPSIYLNRELNDLVVNSFKDFINSNEKHFVIYSNGSD
jgi:hypothetical protein